jgi:hypothetical protein
MGNKMNRIILEYMILDFKFYRELTQYKTLKSIKTNNLLSVGKWRISIGKWGIIVGNKAFKLSFSTWKFDVKYLIID